MRPAMRAWSGKRRYITICCDFTSRHGAYNLSYRCGKCNDIEIHEVHIIL